MVEACSVKLEATGCKSYIVELALQTGYENES